MTVNSASHEPLEQVFDQIQRESGHEDLTGLTDGDLKFLARRHWEWAETVAPGEQDVRVLLEVDGENGDSLSRTILETASPDMPFLVDSVLGECGAQGFEVAALFHPIVKRQDGRSVSVIQVHLPILTHDEAARLKAGVRLALAHNAVAVSDFEPMRARMQQEIDRLKGVTHLKEMDRDEAVAFLKWLSREHFVFLGCREYEFETNADGQVLPEEPIMVEGSNLGVLRDEELNVLSREAEPLVLTPEIGAHLSEPYPILVAKSTLTSLVHRRVACDYVGVKKYDAQGRVNGEVRFLGLFTAEAYDETARSIPLIRRRIAAILEASGATPGGHTEKALTNL
ncbi:MAG TPA: NAD-glutamate dehydrogenase, partial [Hyphomonas sp.]|nr:NAD-glutamate dehydrogenase [Hyphomonas sp.]